MRSVSQAAILCCCLVVGGGGLAVAAGVPGRLQEQPRLTWLVPGFLPPGGLLTVGFSGSRYHPGYNPTGGPAHYDVLQGGVFADWSPLAGVCVSVAQNWRAWSNYLVDEMATAGSGLADGTVRLAAAAPRLPAWLGLAVWAGGNLPFGADGVGEGAFSPEAGASLSLAIWRRSQVPELRLHASCGRRWNGNEAEGFGAGGDPLPQPWYPLYPAALAAGGDRRNDFFFWAAAIEFRQAAAALWIEYSEARLDGARNLARGENQRILTAGLRWGLHAGWALQADCQVGFHCDDLDTAWYPRLPHLGYTMAIARQFQLGGRGRQAPDPRS